MDISDVSSQSGQPAQVFPQHSSAHALISALLFAREEGENIAGFVVIREHNFYI